MCYCSSYAAAGNFLHASDVLARCKDLKSLLMSAVFASQAGAHYVANSRAKDCLNISILTNNWHIGEIVLTKYADLKVCKHDMHVLCGHLYKNKNYQYMFVLLRVHSGHCVVQWK